MGDGNNTHVCIQRYRGSKTKDLNRQSCFHLHTINRVRKHKFSKRQPIIACDVKNAIMAATDTFLALCPYQTIH